MRTENLQNLCEKVSLLFMKTIQPPVLRKIFIHPFV